MKRTMRLTTTVAFTLAIVFSVAAPALAEEPVLVDREVQTVNGAQIAKDIVSSITDVELGSNGATVTLDVEGDERAINLDLGGKTGKGAVGGIFGLAALSGAAATALKVFGKIGRLFH